MRILICSCYIYGFSPPARWGLLDFMSVASSCLLLPPASSSSFRRLLPPAASCRLLPRSPPLRCPRRPRRPRCPRPTGSAIHSVRCRTSTTTIHAQCSLPDLNHDHPRPVFPAGPQPRPSPPSVPCRTSTGVSMPSVPCRTSCRKIWDKENARRYARRYAR